MHTRVGLRDHASNGVVPMCTPFDAWSLRPTRVCILPGMPIGSAVFVHLTRVTNLVTDTPMRHA